MEYRTLFDDGQYRLDVEMQSSSGRVVVFFPHRFATGEGMRRNFGADFAARYGINALLVGAAEPDWFQGDSFADLLEALRRACACFDHVTLTGSSMGGYGAMRAAEVVAADHVLAFSPVSSIDPGAAPHDMRYEADFERIGRSQPIWAPRARRYTVVYDPSDIDRRHLAQLALPEEHLTRITMTGAGHMTQRVLKETGLLSAVTRDLLDGRVPDALDMRAVRKLARQTPTWLMTMYKANLLRRPAVAAWALTQMKAQGAWPAKHGIFERRLRRVTAARQLLAA